MDARHGLRVSVPVCVLLVVPVSCDGDGSSRPLEEQSHNGASAVETTTPGKTATPTEAAPSPEREDPVPCASGTMRSWTVHEARTVLERVDEFGPLPVVVVSRAGTATTVWGADNTFGTADDPPAPGDPQDPAHGDPRVSLAGSLAVDAADVQTLVYSTTVRTGDLVLSDRVPGGEWSSSPAEAKGRARDAGVDLAVNASGAAVVMWRGDKTGGRVYTVYRDGAGGRWTAAQPLPAPITYSNIRVGIDDAGRVLLVGMSVVKGKYDGVWAVRRNRAGAWGTPRQLTGPGNHLFGMALGAGGAAVAIHGPVDGDLLPIGPHFTSRMSAAGTWGAPILQPDGLGARGLAVGLDARGRALLAGWRGADLVGRWSKPDGQWRQPFALASDISLPRDPPGLFPAPLVGPTVEVKVNRRGDAVVGWAAQGRVTQIWTRYKPAGQQWTPPVRLTRAADPPQFFRAAIGECGHVAFVWETSRHTKLEVLRASPRP